MPGASRPSARRAATAVHAAAAHHWPRLLGPLGCLPRQRLGAALGDGGVPAVDVEPKEGPADVDAIVDGAIDGVIAGTREEDAGGIGVDETLRGASD